MKEYTGDIATMECEYCRGTIEGKLYKLTSNGGYYLDFHCSSCELEQQKISKVKDLIDNLYALNSEIPKEFQEVLDMENIEFSYSIAYDELIEYYKEGGCGKFTKGNLVKCESCKLTIPKDIAEVGGHWEKSNDYYSPDEFIENGYMYCSENCEKKHIYAL